MYLFFFIFLGCHLNKTKINNFLISPTYAVLSRRPKLLFWRFEVLDSEKHLWLLCSTLGDNLAPQFREDVLVCNLVLFSEPTFFDLVITVEPSSFSLVINEEALSLDLLLGEASSFDDDLLLSNEVSFFDL